MQLIGLAGRARVGKDTLADYPQQVHGYDRYALADPLRRGLLALFFLEPRHFQGDQKEQPIDWIGKSPRELLQTLGTDWGRTRVAPDIWLRCAKLEIDRARRFHATGLVITDIRFENEAQFVRDQGGQVWHLYRADAPNVRSHVSEAGVIEREGDAILHNVGTLEMLYELADELLGVEAC